jgi:RNA recognition motif-containing protein
MGKKLYVGNLSFGVDDEKLKEAFAVYGEIEEANVLKDKFSGRSKGFGFVTFVNDADADKAIAEMNDKEFEGRNIKVNEAKPFDPDAPRPPRRENGFGNNRGGGGGNRGGFGNRDRQRRF